MAQTEFLLLTRDPVPCRYELGFHDETLSFVLRINRHIVGGPITWVEDKHLDVQAMVKQYGFTKNTFDLSGKDLGFEGVFKFQGEQNGFLIYGAPIPLIRYTGESCNQCGGSGKDKMYANEECLHCEGEGKEIEIRYHDAYALSATLGVVCQRLGFPQRTDKIEADRNQLINYRSICTIPRSHGASVDGEFSPEFVGYLNRFKGQYVREVQTLMERAFMRMLGRPSLPDYYKHTHRVWVEDRGYPWLCIDVPGNATGIYSEVDSSVRSDEGHTFGCHNMDQMFHQLTVLVALAKLHDMARAAGAGM